MNSIPIFDITLSDSTPFAPTTVEELVQFRERELAPWTAFLNEYNKRPYRQGAFLNPVLDALNEAQQAQQAISRLEQHWTVTQSVDQGAGDEIRTRLHRIYYERNLPLSGTHDYALVQSLSVKSHRVAIAALLARVPETFNQGQSFDMSEPESSLAVVYNGILRDPELLSAAGANLLELRREVSAATSTCRRLEADTRIATTKLTDAIKDLLKEGQLQLETQEKAHTTQLAQHEKSLKDELNSTHEQLEAFKKAVEAENAFQAPISYWTNKAAAHAKSRNWFAAIVLASFLIAGWAASEFGASLMPSGATSDPGSLARLGAFVALSLLTFWILRLLVRIFLSQMHLAADARERVTMVQTYLALLAADKAPNKEDLTPLVGSLFRPANDGVVKDEAAPQLWYEWLTRQK